MRGKMLGLQTHFLKNKNKNKNKKPLQNNVAQHD
jgi:hypothetical protein